MEQKTVEQIAAEKYPFDSRKVQSNDDWKVIDATNRAATLQRLGFIDGYNHAQQSQPMWREIEPTLYYDTRYMRNKDSAILRSGSGWELLRDGYTHYLTSEDLLKLPTHTKTTPQERGER